MGVMDGRLARTRAVLPPTWEEGGMDLQSLHSKQRLVLYGLGFWEGFMYHSCRKSYISFSQLVNEQIQNKKLSIRWEPGIIVHIDGFMSPCFGMCCRALAVCCSFSTLFDRWAA